jgi:hypothetical protein
VTVFRGVPYGRACRSACSASLPAARAVDGVHDCGEPGPAAQNDARLARFGRREVPRASDCLRPRHLSYGLRGHGPCWSSCTAAVFCGRKVSDPGNAGRVRRRRNGGRLVAVPARRAGLPRSADLPRDVVRGRTRAADQIAAPDARGDRRIRRRRAERHDLRRGARPRSRSMAAPRARACSAARSSQRADGVDGRERIPDARDARPPRRPRIEARRRASSSTCLSPPCSTRSAAPARSAHGRRRAAAQTPLAAARAGCCRACRC